MLEGGVRPAEREGGPSINRPEVRSREGGSVDLLLHKSIGHASYDREPRTASIGSET